MAIKTKSIMPWFVLVSAIVAFGGILSTYTWRPIEFYEVYLLCMIFVCLAGIVRGYFKMYAIFDRIYSREYERD